jgi:hypothetical protein
MSKSKDWLARKVIMYLSGATRLTVDCCHLLWTKLEREDKDTVSERVRLCGRSYKLEFEENLNGTTSIFKDPNIANHLSYIVVHSLTTASGGVMVSVLASNAVDRGLGFPSGKSRL